MAAEAERISSLTLDLLPTMFWLSKHMFLMTKYMVFLSYAEGSWI